MHHDPGILSASARVAYSRLLGSGEGTAISGFGQGAHEESWGVAVQH
jgi:hypothetical protein